jgi:hypothetical protein
MLSVQEMTGIIGRVVGCKVRHIRVPLWMFLMARQRAWVELTLSCFLSYAPKADVRCHTPRYKAGVDQTSTWAF